MCTVLHQRYTGAAAASWKAAQLGRSDSCILCDTAAAGRRSAWQMSRLAACSTACFIAEGEKGRRCHLGSAARDRAEQRHFLRLRKLSFAASGAMLLPFALTG
ncbi:hypothetical protein CERZMDRAFT_82889 [Cercospora zeae-maydis SCOH1-5]|uniref:Uncharacterized protein n=1 Tax=Cercospora zeae-maydis SCOH1-5 TaxID=717836 RepID=A0A6A6FNH0_9PEZI|nr:hypothetical protein CERZMDRAFT_82889 [Cercospora zeae-maydis SCOH1-5]